MLKQYYNNNKKGCDYLIDTAKKIIWDKLLSQEKFEEERINKGNESINFNDDYEKIIFSSAFRRLQDKTQVFPLENSDFVRTRLTHSLEVSAIAQSIGRGISERIINEGIDAFTSENKANLCKVLSCAGLLHDIGNTHFGHFGEIAIQEYFKKFFKYKVSELKKEYGNDEDEEINDYNVQNLIEELLDMGNEQVSDYINFDGNAQALRVITYLQQIKKNEGINLTYGTLSALIKYPRTSREGNDSSKNLVSYKKYGYLQSEKNNFELIIDKTGLKKDDGTILRNPIVYIVEAADDIAYSASDIEDGIKKGLLSIEYLREEIWNSFSEKYKEQINNEDYIGVESDMYEKIGPEKWSIYIKLDNDEKNIIKAFYDKLQFTDSFSSFERVQLIRETIQRYMMKAVIDEYIKSYNLIMEGVYEKELLNESNAGIMREKLKNITYLKIFNSKEIIKNELAGEKVISKLLDLFINAVLIVDRDKQVIGKKSLRVYGLISENYKIMYENYTNKDVYSRIQLVVDFISGMTDSYALELYKQLQGIIIQVSF